jgi:hypothetical protein
MYSFIKLRNEVIKSDLPKQVFAYYLYRAKEKGLIVKTDEGYKFKLFQKRKFVKYMKENEEKWKKERGL